MASMRDIKRRKDSIQSTGQITKAMKLVSTVKLQKAKGRAENTKPYFDLMYETVQSILAKSGHINHKYLKESESDKKAVIVVTANRGLAGGYNSNITRMIIDEGFTKENTVVYAVGKKARRIALDSLTMQGIHRRVVQRLPVHPQSVRRFFYPRISKKQSPLAEGWRDLRRTHYHKLRSAPVHPAAGQYVPGRD